MTIEVFLKRVPFFSDLSEADLQELARLGETQAVEANEVVFREGAPGGALYIILSGAVTIHCRDEHGHEVELATLTEGDFFGELALIDAGPRPATASAAGPSELFQLSREAFLSLLSNVHPMFLDLLAGLSGKIRYSNAQFFELRFQQERLRAQTEIERHRSISQMVAGVAHEINTPLGIVNNAASILSETLTLKAIPALAKDQNAQAVLTDLVDASTLIQNNIARAAHLIQSFKNLSVRQVTDSKEEVDFGTLTEEVVGLYRLKARQSKLDLEVVDELGELDRMWEGYPGHFSQIILNLLTNIDCYAYPEDQGGKVKVVVSRDQGEGEEPRFSVVVQDFGRGIPEADLPKVFEAFFTTGRSRGGTGLGLAIVHNLVTSSLRGTVKIVSAPDEGTQVVMSLPRTVQGEPGE